MKKKGILTSICILLLLSIITTGCGKDIEVKNGSKVAVSTKEGKISATEYYEKIKESNISTLIDMIDKEIFDKMFKDKDSKEEDESINKQIEQIKSYYGENEETYKSIIKQYFGVESEDELKDKLRLDYRRNKAVEEYILKNITDDEIKDYFDKNITGEIKASHILVSVDVKNNATDKEKEKAEKKAEKEAQDIIKKLDKGEDFAKLAKKSSDDEATATNGGDLGYFQPSDMTKSFADAVKDLKVKEYTKEPVKTEYGYHIILKTGEKDKPKLDDVKDDIKEKIKNEKTESNKAIYYETLMEIRNDSKITWNDTKLKKAYNEYMNKLIENAKSAS